MHSILHKTFLCDTLLFIQTLLNLSYSYTDTPTPPHHTTPPAYIVSDERSIERAHFTNNISITIHMWWKFQFALIFIVTKWSLWMLHMARQLCFHGMCKLLLWYVYQQLNCSWMEFPSNLNCDQNIVSEMGPNKSWRSINESMSHMSVWIFNFPKSYK